MSALTDEESEPGPWTPLEDDGFIGLVGPMWVAPAPQGEGRFRFRAEPKHKNRRGVVQGGMLMTFADRALGTTARQDDPSALQATVQLDVHFLDGVQIGETVEIACRVLRRTALLIFMDGTMTVGDRSVATARGTWKRLRPQAQSAIHADETNLASENGSARVDGSPRKM